MVVAKELLGFFKNKGTRDGGNPQKPDFLIEIVTCLVFVMTGFAGATRLLELSGCSGLILFSLQLLGLPPRYKLPFFSKVVGFSQMAGLREFYPCRYRAKPRSTLTLDTAAKSRPRRTITIPRFSFDHVTHGAKGHTHDAK